MSQTRQTTIGDGFAVRSLSLTFRDRHRIEPHAHPWAQLVYASTGLMRVSLPAVSWLVPPTRAIWVAAGELHSIEVRGTTSLRTLYVAPEWAATLPAGSRALEVAPLLRELILHVVAQGMLDPADPPQERLAGLLVDLLKVTPTSPLSCRCRAISARAGWPSGFSTIWRCGHRSRVWPRPRGRACAPFSDCFRPTPA